MNQKNKGMIKKFLKIQVEKLQEISKLLYLNCDFPDEMAKIYSLYAQLNEITGWCMDLLKDFQPDDLKLFIYISEKIRQEKLSDEISATIIKDLVQLYHLDLEGENPLLNEFYEKHKEKISVLSKYPIIKKHFIETLP